MCHKNNSIPCLNTCTKLQKFCQLLLLVLKEEEVANYSFCTCAHRCIRGIVKFIEGKVRVLECIVWLSVVDSKKILWQYLKEKLKSHFDFVWVICCLWMLQRVWNDLSHWLTSFSRTWTLLCSIMSQAAYPPAGPGYAYRPGQGYPPGEAAQNMFKLGACRFLLSLAYSTNCKWCMQ